MHFWFDLGSGPRQGHSSLLQLQFIFNFKKDRLNLLESHSLGNVLQLARVFFCFCFCFCFGTCFIHLFLLQFAFISLSFSFLVFSSKLFPNMGMSISILIPLHWIWWVRVLLRMYLCSLIERKFKYKWMSLLIPLNVHGPVSMQQKSNQKRGELVGGRDWKQTRIYANWFIFIFANAFTYIYIEIDLQIDWWRVGTCPCISSLIHLWWNHFKFLQMKLICDYL